MAEIKLTQEQQQTIAAAVLMTVAVGFLYFKFFWAPTSKRIAESKQKIAAIEAKIHTAEATAARLPQLKRRLAELEVLAEQAEDRLPKQKEVPKLIELLSDLAKEHHVEITTINPAGGGKRENYQENLYSLAVQGTYTSLAHFLTGLGLEERILHSRNLTISPLTSSLVPGATIGAQFTLVVFQYKG